MSYFGSNMAYLRSLEHLGQKDVAIHIGCTTSAIANYEAGKREPTLIVAATLARYFGRNLEEMIFEDLRDVPILLSKNLKYLRNRDGYRQEDMSQILGYSNKSSYCLIEKGRYEPGIKGLVNLAQFFGITTDDLLKKDLEKEGF